MWTVSVGATGGVAQPIINQIQTLTAAAANYWSWYLDDSIANISITLDFETLDDTTLAEGGTTLFFSSSQSGFDIYEPTTITELNTGVDNNGSSADITISINSAEANAGTFFLGPLVDGLSPGAPGKFDLFTVLVHEIAHGLGLLTFLDDGGSDRTTFDLNVNNSFGSYTFTGANAIAVFGGAVPLDESIAHVSTSIAQRLFSPIIAAGDVNYISALEVAILADIGAPIRTAGTGADQLYGFMSGDVISGLAGNDTIFGLGGNDQLSGDAGNDILRGELGNDSLYGGDHSDQLFGGAGDDSLDGGVGNDTLVGGAGGDTLIGGAGVDVAKYDDASGGVNVSLFAGSGSGNIAAGDILNLIENLIGSSFADTLVGDDVSSNLINGGGGGDSLSGRAGNDTLNGDDGDDTIDGGDGDDTIGGNAGRDLVFGGDGVDTLHGFGSHDSLYGGEGNDDLRGGFGKDLLNGSNGDDILRGFEGDDRLFGGGGSDTLLGNDDNDSLIGGGGGDRLKGDDGDDTLNGSFGADTVTGGLGDDLFEFRQTHGADIIDDFTAGAASEDVIKLIAFGAAFDAFAEVLAASSQIGADVVIDFGGGDSITLANVALANLHADDFMFG